MYTEKQIKQLFDNDVIEYLRKKNKGGASNEKGNTYENLFAVYQIALLSKDTIENTLDIKLYSQILAFVDDFIIDDNIILQHYQLKNSTKNITWGNSLKSISDDFKKQNVLNQSISRASKLSLVVSNINLKDTLEKSLPSEIKAFSQVLHFPYEPSLAKFIAREPAFQKAIEYLSAFEKPEPDKIECVATVLLGAWVSSDKSGVAVMDILKKAQESTPSYIRSFSSESQLDPEVENILSNIENFSYNVTKGFLHWSYAGGLDEGTLPYSVDSDKFSRFQDLVKRSNPTSFEQLEVFLI